MHPPEKRNCFYPTAQTPANLLATTVLFFKGNQSTREIEILTLLQLFLPVNALVIGGCVIMIWPIAARKGRWQSGQHIVLTRRGLGAAQLARSGVQNLGYRLGVNGFVAKCGILPAKMFSAPRGRLSALDRPLIMSSANMFIGEYATFGDLSLMAVAGKPRCLGLLDTARSIESQPLLVTANRRGEGQGSEHSYTP